MRFKALLLTAPLALAMNGCWFGKKAAVAPPPRPPQPVAVNPPAPSPPVAKETEKEQELPVIRPAPLPSPEAVTIEPPPVAEPPKKRPSRPVRRPNPTPETPAIAPAETPPPARLEEVLTDDRRRQLESDFAKSVTEARAALSQTARRSLSAAQRQSVERIRTFLQQADQAKKADLATAVQLARRADLLAQDLRKSLQ